MLKFKDFINEKQTDKKNMNLLDKRASSGVSEH